MATSEHHTWGTKCEALLSAGTLGPPCLLLTVELGDCVDCRLGPEAGAEAECPWGARGHWVWGVT